MGAAGSRPGALLRQARDAGILAGACGRASSGCASEDPARRVAELAEAAGVPLLADLAGHASVEPFVRQGYELVVLRAHRMTSTPARRRGDAPGASFAQNDSGGSAITACAPARAARAW